MATPSNTINGIAAEDILNPLKMQPEFVERVAYRKVKRPEIEIVEPDPAWAEHFQTLRSRILTAFDLSSAPHGEAGKASDEGNADKVTILSVEHVGSTSVPMFAKAVIDIDLVLSDNGREAEAFYVPRLEAAGFQYLFREPKWYGHRFFAAHEPMSCNLHVFGPRNAMVERHRIFKGWLRGNDADRELYASTKKEAAAAAREQGETVDQYSDRKEEVVRAIMARAVEALRSVA